MESEQVAVEIFELGTIGRMGDEQYYRRFQGNWYVKMGIMDGDVNHSNMRWLGHITTEPTISSVVTTRGKIMKIITVI